MLTFGVCPTGPCRQGGRAWRFSKLPKGGENEEFDQEQEEDDEEKEEDDEEEKEIYEKEKEIEGKRRDEVDMQDSLVVEENRIVKFPLVSLPLISFPCISCCKVLSAEKKLNNHIVEMLKDPASCILCQKILKQRKPISGTALYTSHHQTPEKAVEMPFGEEKASRGTRSPATRRSALLVGPVQPLWQELLKKFQSV